MSATSDPVSPLTIQFDKHIPDEMVTVRLAAALAKQCVTGDCILLCGDLGAGKTAFARGFIRSLCGAQEEVVSPTFTLVQTYPTQTGATIWHFDLYRLRAREDSREIGLEDALSGGITLIEWPELVQNDLPGEALRITIRSEDSGERMFTFSGWEAVWHDRLNFVKDI